MKDSDVELVGGCCATAILVCYLISIVLWVVYEAHIKDWLTVRKMRKSIRELYDEDYPRAHRLPDGPTDGER